MTADVVRVRPHPVAAPTATEQAAFVREHLAFVWRAVRRFGVPESDASDATQRVFVAAMNRFVEIEAGRERAFLFGTAVRIASKVRRSLARQPKLSPSDPDEQASEVPSTEELVEQRRARAVLDAILDKMPEDLRTVFVLFEIEQMTTPEIAELLEIALGTVASRLRRAREFFERSVSRKELKSGALR